LTINICYGVAGFPIIHILPFLPFFAANQLPPACNGFRIFLCRHQRTNGNKKIKFNQPT
jgi:hypothetical protein